MIPMIVRIRKKASLQYILLYLMLLANGSRIWVVTMRRQASISLILEVLVIVLMIALSVLKPYTYRLEYGFIIALILLANIVFVRIIRGGVGIQIWIEWLSYIAITYLAIFVDREHILDRYINILYFLGLFSIVGYVLQIVTPDLLKSILGRYDSNFSIGTGYGDNFRYISQSAWGKFLFSFDERQITKNVGIFSEPGVYQIVLNTELFILLFLRKNLNFTSKQYIRRIVVAVIAVLTSQSTTGYFGLIILVLFFYFDRTKGTNTSKLKHNLIIVGLMGILLITIDYNVRGEASLIHSAIISKIINESGKLTLNTSTGVYRLGTIGTSFSMMLKHPLGVGYDAANSIISNTFAGSTGAAIVVTGAALGICSIITITLWTLIPIINCKKISYLAKGAFVLIWLNSILAQSEEIYTGLIIMPLICYEVNKKNINLD